MTSKPFFDTNVLVYFVEDDPRAARAEALLSAGGTLSVQVLNEFVHVCLRKKRHAIAQIEGLLSGIRTLCDIVPLDLATHDRALAIAKRYGFAFYDSLIVAAALDAGCDTLFTEDLQHGQTIDGALRIVNPFLGTP